MRKRIFWIIIWILSWTNNYSSDFRYLRPYEGLMDSEINSIVQDQDGLMWFATWSGLISYDGYNFNHYRPELGNPNSLFTKKIKLLFVDSQGNIWIATDKNLSHYDKTKDIFTNFQFEREENSPLNILHLSELSDKLIIHALDGLYYIPLKPEPDHNLSAKRIEIRSAVPDEHYYFEFSMAVNDVMYFSNTSQSRGTGTVYTGEFSDFDGVPHFYVRPLTSTESRINRMVFVEPENSIYMATDNGVKTYSIAGNQFIKKTFLPGKRIQNIVYTNDNKIYCSAQEPVLYYIDIHTGTTGKYEANPNRWGSLLNNNILCLYEDFSGNLWIGHQGQGISILDLYKKEFYTYRHNPANHRSLISNTIMSINEGPDEVFIGTRVGGINYMDLNNARNKETEFKKVNYRQGNNLVPFTDGVWDIQQVSDDLYLVGTIAGIFEMKKNKGEWELTDFSEDPIFSESVRKIYVDENSNVWMGIVGQGLVFVPDILNNPPRNYFVFNKEESDPESLSENEIISMKVDSENRFWIGTTYGLNLVKTPYPKLDLSGKVKPDIKFRRFIAEYPDPNYLNNNEINCIFENFDGNLWLATQGGGINIFDPETYSFSHITKKDNLPSNDVLGILRDESGILWMSTNNGLVSYNQHEKNPKFIQYGYQDGVQGNIFMVNSYFKSRTGVMYFGGDNGFTRFYPRDIKPNNIPPKLYLTDLKIYNEQVGIGDTLDKEVILPRSLNSSDKITLPYTQKVFSVGVAPIHFQYSEGNIVAYKLEGYDKDWKWMFARNRYITYSNLPFGKYTLVMTAISADNIQPQDVRRLEIEITPPWYRQWYFMLLFILVGLGIIGSFIFIAVNREKLAYQKKLHELSIEANESKMQFLTNIAHGLRTPLSLVIGPVEDMIQNYTDVSSKWRNHLYLIHRNSNYLLKLINQIIDFRKLHAGKLKLYRHNIDIASLVQEVSTNFKGLEGKRKINLEFELPEQPVIAFVDTQKIEEVLYNLLSNAFKHTPENGTIRVSVSTPGIDSRDEEVRISVYNEGSRIQEKDQQKIFERFYKTDESTEGAGIGLSFSRSLIELHDGRIEAQSVGNEGTIFNIYLPIEKNASVEDKLTDNINDRDLIYNLNEELIEGNKSEDDKRLKILLVEDNEDLRGFLRNVLSRVYSCYEAGNGEEGMEKVKEIMPDIVISDIIMPVVDGYAFCKAIKDTPGTCHIPVILLTAKDTTEQIKSGYDIGADAYVTKPFDLGVISAQISRLIKNRELIRKKYIDQNFMIEVNRSNLSKDDEFIINIRKLMEANISEPDYNVKEMASSLNISSTQLYRKVKALTGYSPVEFIRLIKLQKAYEHLVERNKSVKEVCYLSGFNNVSYFIKCFKDQFGITPASLRDGSMEEDLVANNTEQSKVPKLDQ